MTDRELLELAASAIGLEGYEWVESPFDCGLFKRNFEDCGLELPTQSFNPLDNDGDALRLAVRLELEVCSFKGKSYSGNVDTTFNQHQVLHSECSDPCAATRRAIVRAAAEIGRGGDVMKTNVTDEDIEIAFRNTDFGGANHRSLLEQGVLKKTVGYHSGWTLTQIMIKIGLTTEKGNITKKGRDFMFEAFYKEKHSG